ncbi:MAG: hypothetical protein WDN27_05460 [Candidatus Saccharibacteria bacterium]
MLPSGYTDFLVATVTAAASFIGLLFVAMTLVMDKSGKSKRQITTENIMAEGSYLALLNLFFVGLVGLIPQTSLGYVFGVMGVLGLSNSARLLTAGRRDGVSRGILGVSSAVYAAQLVYGVILIFNSNQMINQAAFITIVFTLFGSALGRAWELTGVSTEKAD